MSLLFSVKIFMTLAGLTVAELLHFENVVYFQVAFGLTLVVAIWTFCLVVFTEPGLLPSREQLEQSVSSTSKAAVALNSAYRDMYAIVEPDALARIYGEFQRTRATLYECHACRVFKPTASTSHCEQCNACVVGKDHHCVFLGTCVGVRNRANFTAFLLAGVVAMGVSVFFMGYRMRHFFEAKGSFESLTAAEWATLGIFGLILALKIFVFPFLLGYLANLQILLVVFIAGLAAVIVLGIQKHLPWIPGLVAYFEVILIYFMGSALYYQLSLLHEGSTVRQMIHAERGDRDEDTAELDLLVAKQKARDGKTWAQTVGFVLSGFLLTSHQSYLLE